MRGDGKEAYQNLSNDLPEFDNIYYVRSIPTFRRRLISYPGRGSSKYLLIKLHDFTTHICTNLNSFYLVTSFLNKSFQNVYIMRVSVKHISSTHI
jgi:hypothetical protein